MQYVVRIYRDVEVQNLLTSEIDYQETEFEFTVRVTNGRSDYFSEAIGNYIPGDGVQIDVLDCTMNGGLLDDETLQIAINFVGLNEIKDEALRVADAA